MTDKQLDEIYKLMLLIKGSKKRFLYYDDNGKEQCFKYPPGTVENWNKRLETLILMRNRIIQERQR